MLSIALATLAGCGVRPKQCEVYDPHFYRAPPTDMGNGMIGIDTSSVTFSAASDGGVSNEVGDCATGRELTLRYVWVDYANEKVVAAGPAAQAFAERLLDSDWSSYDELKAAAREAGVDLSEITRDTESCGCAAFYPELRGQIAAYDPEIGPY